jgi:alpha-L-fucosidase 2
MAVSMKTRFLHACTSGILLLLLNGGDASGQPTPAEDLRFSALALTWDEGIPLGNGLLGALLWQKGENLRLSLDRADLWDERPIAEFARPEFRFSWVAEQVRKNDYAPVQTLFDLPYDRDPAPTKIPAAALEFNTAGLGRAADVQLDLLRATCCVRWSSGAILTTFVHATSPVGWYRFENVPSALSVDLVPPPYAAPETPHDGMNPVVDGQDLRRLGYPAPIISRGHGTLQYIQAGYGKFRYEVETRWHRPRPDVIEGVWAVSAHPSYQQHSRTATEECNLGIGRGWSTDRTSHEAWWGSFWLRSTVDLPDSVLEKQWYREWYKFGSVARRGAPPITLQAVWTADNGKLPPWKGDIHNDLNTQLSYWPAYSGNHLEAGLSFLDWLWRCRPVFRDFTRTYFGTMGLNVPGVSTLAGAPMGGWIQYALSPTVSAWLAHHFYLHWRYSLDRRFLRERAYPWIADVALHLDQLALRGPDGKRRLPLSSSPEINDNKREAWFTSTTNYDLALIRWLYGAAAELAGEIGYTADQRRWRTLLNEWPALSRDSADGSLLVGPGVRLTESHRHFSHLMAIHPLGLIDRAHGGEDRTAIAASVARLDSLGPSLWTGYSYSWFGCILARAGEGERAAGALRAFAECFCLPNTFHANGDQSGTGKSSFTYRPFTLEGNFAFAQGIQEMLLQSHSGIIRVFPAVPSEWQDVRFTTLRAEGAFLVSAKRKEGHTIEVRVTPEQDGTLRLMYPFGDAGYTVDGIPSSAVRRDGEILEIASRTGVAIVFLRAPGP